MAIDLGTLQEQTSGSFALDLKKGFSLDLGKDGKGLKNLTFGLGWDVVPGYGNKFDLDISAISYVNDIISPETVGEQFVWYKNGKIAGLEHKGDNRDGTGEGDDEKIVINLEKVPGNVNRIRLFVTIFEFEERVQNFGLSKNAYVSLHDDDEGGREELRFNLTDEFSMFTGVVVGDLVRKGNTWNLTSIGEGFAYDINKMLDANSDAAKGAR